MNTAYQILFRITVVHDYYTDTPCDALHFMPDAHTAAVLRNQHMLFKQLEDEAWVLVRVGPNGKPFITLGPEVRLRFYVGINNVYFGNFTRIHLSSGGPTRYYFSNLNGSEAAGTSYLHSTPGSYQPASTYAIGELVTGGAGHCFEAIKPVAAGGPAPGADPAYWLDRGDAPVVNDLDEIAFAGDRFWFPVAAAKDFTIEIRGRDPGTADFTVSVRKPEPLHFDTLRNSVPVSLEGLPPDRYLLEVNGQTRVVYYDPAAAGRALLGVVEISGELAAASSFSLLDAAGAPKGARWRLHFPNRAVLWRYLPLTDRLQEINDEAGQYQFSLVAPKDFVSSAPIPLTEKPLKTLSATLLLRPDDPPETIHSLDNPGMRNLRTLLSNGDTYYCIEKYLHY